MGPRAGSREPGGRDRRSRCGARVATATVSRRRRGGAGQRFDSVAQRSVEQERGDPHPGSAAGRHHSGAVALFGRLPPARRLRTRRVGGPTCHVRSSQAHSFEGLCAACCSHARSTLSLPLSLCRAVGVGRPRHVDGCGSGSAAQLGGTHLFDAVPPLPARRRRRATGARRQRAGAAGRVGAGGLRPAGGRRRCHRVRRVHRQGAPRIDNWRACMCVFLTLRAAPLRCRR